MSLTKCPICGYDAGAFLIEPANVIFLNHLAAEGKIDAAISLTKIVWENIPHLGHNMELKATVDELTKALLRNTQEQLNKVLEPMKVFLELFPKIIESLPDDIRKDVKEEFNETRMRLENEFKLLRDATPTFKDTLNAIQVVADRVNEATETKMEEIRRELTDNFKETLERMGFPQPEQMKLLAQLIPPILPLLEELLRFQKIPSEKGKQGELELIQQLQDYYPEDEYEYLGGPGDTDILATPRFNGTSLGQKILIESKKNDSGWKRSFIQQVRNQMQMRGERFAILAVEVMPRSANSFLFEQCSEGVILVTDSKYFQVSYGAVRSALIATHSFQRKEIDFHKLFTDKKINEAIEEANRYCEWTKKMREKTRRIANNASGLMEDINQLDHHLRRSLREVQTLINNAVEQIAPTSVKHISTS